MKAAAKATEKRAQGALKNISAQKGRESVLPKEYQAIFKNTGKPMVIVEEDATISLANDEFEKLSGYKRKEIEGKKSWTEFVARNDRKRVKEYHHLRRSDPMLAPRCFEFRFLDRHGIAKNIVLTIGTIPGTQKSMASLQDVTDRRRAEASLRVSEERYHTLFENSRDAFYITTSDGAYLDANQAALDMFGYTREQMRKVNARQLYADHADAQRFQQEIKKKGFVRDFEVKLRKKDGTVMDCLFTVTAQRADDGGILEYQGIIRDITDRKQMEKKLQQNEERYRTLVEKVNFGVNLIDTQYNIVMANAEQSKRMHKPVSELIGKKCFREFEKRDAVCPHCPGVKTLASGQPAEAEAVAVRDDGSRFHVRLQTFPISEQDGTTTGFIEVIEDITDRKRAEKKIERLAFFTKLNPMPIVEITPKGHFTYANPAAQHLFPDLGTRQGEHPFLAGLKPYFAKLRKKKETYVLREVEADGGWYSQVIVLVDPEHIRIYSTDITDRKQMEEELRESEERFKMLAEDAPFGISIMAPDRSFEYLNPQFTKIFGYTIEDIPDKDTWFKKAYPNKAYRDKVISIWKRDIAEEIKIGDENPRVFTVCCKDGQDKIIDFRSVDLKDGKQYLVYEDITARAKAEEALKQSEERYRVLVENIKLGINLIDADHNIMMVNAAQEKYFKKPRAQFVGKKCFHEFEKRDAVCPHCPAVRAMATKKPAEVETVLTADDGSHFHVRIQAFPIFGKDGTVTSFIEIAEIITERKQAEELLLQEKETFYTILQNALYGVGLIDRDGKYLYVNPEFTKITGYTLEDIPTGRDWMHKAFPDKEYRQKVIEAWKKDCGSEGMISREFRVVCKDGETKEIEFRPTQLIDGRAIVMLADITERKQMELELRESEGRFRNLFEQSNDAIFLHQYGKIIDVNQKACEMLGYTKEHLLTMEIADLHPEKDRADSRKRTDTSQRGESILFETHWVRADGTMIDVEVGSRIVDHEKKIIQGIGRDITERKRAEQALQKSQEELQTIMDASPVAMSWADLQGNIQYINRKHHELFGYTLEDIPTIADWRRQADQDPDQHERFAHWQDEAMEAHGDGRMLPPREMTVTCKDGSIRYVTVEGTVACNRTLAVYNDITERKQMEETLRESEKRFKMLAEEAPFGISIMAPDRSFEYLNPRFTEIFGYTMEDIPDKDTWFKKAYPDKTYRNKVMSTWKRDITEAVRIGKENLRFFTVRCKDGQDKIIDFRSVDLKDGKQHLVYEDITVRARAEEALRESEERYRTLVENIKLGINLIDSDYNIIMVNAALSRRLKKQASEMIGKKCFREFEKRDAVCPNCPGVQAMATGQPAEDKIEGVRDDGRPFYMRLQAFPVFGQDGTVTCFIEVIEDITERKQAEELLQQEKETFYTILQNALYGVALMEADGKHVYVNPEFTAITGYTLEDIPTGKDWMHKAYPDKKYRQEVTKYWRKDSKLGGTKRVVSINCKNGKTKEIETSRTPLENGLSVVMLSDITERKRAEQALQKSQEELQSLMDASPAAISWADLQGNIQYINRKHHELFGYTLEDIPTIAEWQRQADQDPTQRKRFAHWGEELIEAHRQGRAVPPREMTVTCKDGSVRYVTVEGTIASNHNLVIHNDITERKQMEDELRKSEERFRGLIETTKVGVNAIDEKGVIIYANERLSEMWGYPMDEIIRRSTLDFLDEENLKILKGHLAKREKGERESYEITWTRKDGSKVPTILSPTPIFDTDGRFKGSYGFITDITERKRMEERLHRYAADLERSNEEVKNFAYIVSHDLRVPLVNLKGYTSELHSALEVVGPAMETVLPHLNEDKRSAVAMALHEDVPEALEFITNSVSRMDSFINSVLILSRLGRRELKPEPIDMNALVQMSLGNLSHQIQERGTKVTIGSLPQVVADRTAMEQIMGNILGNAVKYLDPERPGQIEVTAQTNNGEQLFRIHDNGRGIAQEDMHKVFAPFRRAGKQDTQGEGMGLAYVQTLIYRHNGRIWCESKLGKGTTFTFSISQLRAEGRDHVSH